MLTDDVLEKIGELLSAEFKERFALRKDVDDENPSPMNYLVIDKESSSLLVTGNFTYSVDLMIYVFADVTLNQAASVRSLLDELQNVCMQFEAQVNDVEGTGKKYYLGNVLVYWCEAGMIITNANSEKLEAQIPLKLTVNY